MAKSEKSKKRRRPRHKALKGAAEGSTSAPMEHPATVRRSIAVEEIDPGGVGEDPESVIDLSAYPILTEQVMAGALPSGTTAPPSGVSLGQTVDITLRQILGWKPRTDDPNGFFGALSQSFTLTQFEGHTESAWVRRTYAVQTDLSGGITGAQASILTQARSAIEPSVPLIEGLTPLRPDPDIEYIQAVKAVIIQQARSLVDELGILGGPRPARVDQIFLLLLGLAAGDPVPDPDNVTGEFGKLRAQLGLRKCAPTTGSNEPYSLGNTVDDERAQTNFWVGVQYMTGLWQAWVANRPYFVRGASGAPSPFFGTQLVLISRVLSVVAEAVEEVRFAMDSVFIGPAERQTLELQLTGRTGRVNMFVEELLTWIYSFAAEEGPQMVRDGGRFAVGGAFLQIVRQLMTLSKCAINPGNLTHLPAGYRTPRVRRTLQELSGRLNELVALSVSIQPPQPLS